MKEIMKYYGRTVLSIAGGLVVTGMIGSCIHAGGLFCRLAEMYFRDFC